MAPNDDFNHVLIAKGAKQIMDAGGAVQLGAHGQLQGLGAHWELWMLQQGGMTPLEALRAATIDGARYLGLDGDIGSIEKGKLADLIVLDRNPLENIRNSESIDLVVLNGRVYDSKTLNEVGNHPRERAKFSPMEALRAATIDGARYLGLDADIGSIRKASSPTSSSSIGIRSRTSGTPSRSISWCSTDVSTIRRR